MIRRLSPGDRIERSVDKVVIGAGTVGLVVASELAKRGYSVICLESGEETQIGDEHPLNAVVQARRDYDGAAHGRFRCLGGTSTRWGGALIPFLRADLARAGWPIDPDELYRHVPDVEALFDLPAGSYGLPGQLGADGGGFVARLAKWPPFARRNVARLLDRTVRRSERLEVWLAASATDFRVEGDRLTRVVSRSPEGGELSVDAAEVLFCAGAIETTRLLLLLDRQNDGRIFAPDDQLGRYFGDHHSIVVADLDPIDRKALNQLAGFRFEPGGAMRNLRFEIDETSTLREKLPPLYAHIAFDAGDRGGFAALRNLYRLVQQRRYPSWALVAELMRSVPWLVRAIWWRFVRKRLLYPATAAVQLHIAIEQHPDPLNRVRLSDDARDAFGLPLGVIDWDVSAEDHAGMRRAIAAFEEYWRSSGLSGLAAMRPRSADEIARALSDSGGIFHPVGSTRMGRTAESAVVDDDLRPFRLRNAMILSTSVLPASGGANPTMMLLLLAFRYLNRLHPAPPQSQSEEQAGRS